MSSHKSTICALLVLGVLFSATQLILAQTRAIQPVRIEAITALEESISYIYEESHALVIGVSNYTNGWSKLAGVKEDVIEVQRALQENGFEVQLLEDPDKQQLEATIEDFIFEKGANPENRLLIYYAGHGHTKTLGYGGEMGYLVPADAPLPKKGRDIAFQRSVMSMQEIEVFAKNTSDKHVLFMFDACFAGSVFLATRAAPSYIEVFTEEPVRQFITSGSADQEVPDNSIFRRAFVDALAGSADFDKDGYLTGSELGTYIQKRTAEDWKGKLNPQYGKLQDSNLNKEDFVFRIGKSATQSYIARTATANSDLAAQAWEVVKDSTNPKILEEYIRMFHTAPQRYLAKLKLMTLESPPPVQLTDNQVTAKVLSGEAAKRKLLEAKECIWCDLREANLIGMDLTEVNLEGANLHGAKVSYANLREAKLFRTQMPDGLIYNRDCAQVQANMNESSKVFSRNILIDEAAKKKLVRDNECVGCDLKDNYMKGLYLGKADLRGANLMGADLRDVDLTEANLTNANILGANTVGAKFCKTTMPNGSINNRDCKKSIQSQQKSGLILSGEAARKKLLATKECTRCELSQADLYGVDLGNANLRGANLRGANLRGSNLTEANLSGALLRAAKLYQANFCDTTMPDGSINNRDC